MLRLPFAAIAGGFTLLIFLLWRPASGNDSKSEAPAGPPGSVHVQVDLVDSSEHLDGWLDLATVTLKTSTGSQTVDLQFIRRITFPPVSEGEGYDSIQTTDKSVIRGRLMTATFPVWEGDAHQSLTRAQIREIRVIRPADSSLLAIAVGLITLAVMEIVLGIDNIIFLAIVAGRLPRDRQNSARKIGLAAALGTRLLLLLSLSWMLGLTKPIFTLPSLPFLNDLERREVSGRDLILFAGGLFLIGKSVREMHEKLEEARHAAQEGGTAPPAVFPSFARVIATIAVVDIIFSLDSVITAVGMVEELWVMAAAMIIAMGVMMFFQKPIAEFVDKHPTIKVLALSFMILIGVMLVAEALGQHIDKGYIYFAMAFGVGVEMINLRLRKAHAKEPAHESL